MRWLVLWLSSVFVTTGCLTQIGQLSPLADAGVDAGPGPDACRATGGNCVIGPASNCAGLVLTKYDCNPDRNPCGAICCLAGDAGLTGDTQTCSVAGGKCQSTSDCCVLNCCDFTCERGVCCETLGYCKPGDDHCCAGYRCQNGNCQPN